MLKRIFFKFGPFAAVEPLVLEPAAMTVFVGPNNSGKSLVLRELRHYAEEGPNASRYIIEGIELAIPPDDEVRSLMKGREVRPPKQERIAEGHIRVTRPIPSSGSAASFDVNFDSVIQHLTDYRTRQVAGDDTWWKGCWAGIFSGFASLFTVALDGKTRLALTEHRAAGDLLAAPPNHLAALFQRDASRKRVRQIAYEAFGLHFVIDPTHLGHLRIRMASRPPVDDQEEQSYDHRARSFHVAATEISELSDGVKAFVGLISALISSDYRIMLVDEPEAFLHPPLAQQLGREMATLADERSGNVFASTHSSRFLMGCVESGKPTNIVRLTYKGAHATARVLPAPRIRELMLAPLLRSAGVLDALFYSGAVVCEADKDRVFYAEINNRLQASACTHIPDAIFLNAQNKQTVRSLAGPLREMGIPAAVAVDFDIIKGHDLRNLLKACFVPPDIIHSLGQLRGHVEAHFLQRDLDMKQGGITLLTGDAHESCQSLLNQLADYGIFVVPHGEVESWLEYLGMEASKENWLPAIFERMKADPSEPDYIRPRDDDVWRFLEDVAKWARNESRLGMPRPQSGLTA